MGHPELGLSQRLGREFLSHTGRKTGGLAPPEEYRRPVQSRKDAAPPPSKAHAKTEKQMARDWGRILTQLKRISTESECHFLVLLLKLCYM
jgi:hypothetical protein